MGQTLSCTIEAPSKMDANIAADLHASFYEDGGIEPCSIIKSNQKSRVEVEIDFTASDLARAFCLDWCIKVAFEGCGAAPEGNLPVQRVPQKVCETSKVKAVFEIPAGYFNGDAGGGCGDVYQLCVTVVAFDTCTPAKPLPFAGFCKGGTIMVFPG